MRFVTLAAVIISLVVNNVAYASGVPDLLPDNIYGTPPPKFVDHWLRFSVLGDRTAPFVVVWVSPQKFKRSGFEKLIVLPKHEYHQVASASRSNTCADTVKLYPGWRMLQATEHSANQEESVCVLPHASACRFLTQLSALPSQDWSEPKTKPISILAADMECPGANPE